MLRRTFTIGYISVTTLFSYLEHDIAVVFPWIWNVYVLCPAPLPPPQTQDRSLDGARFQLIEFGLGPGVA